MPDQSSTDIAWAAGLFEGEGCFAVIKRPDRNPAVVAVLSMTDRDVVERFMRIVGCGAIYFRPEVRANHKPTYMWRIQEAARVREVIALLLPWLGERRTTKALEVDVVAAATSPHVGQRTHCPKGHPYGGENLLTEPIKRASGNYLARRCRICRTAQSRDRARLAKGITPDRFRI